MRYAERERSELSCGQSLGNKGWLNLVGDKVLIVKKKVQGLVVAVTVPQ